MSPLPEDARRATANAAKTPVVVAAEVLTALGRLEETWQGLLAGKCGLRPRPVPGLATAYPLGLVDAAEGALGSTARLSYYLRAVCRPLAAMSGVMARASVGTDKQPPGCTVVEIGARAMTFAERAAGRTLPPWHRIELERAGLPVVTRGKPERREADRTDASGRPDFGVNDEYPQVRARWRFDAGWTIASSAALSGRTVVFGDASGSVRALRVADGSIAWEFKVGEPVYSTPEAAGDRVVFGGTDGKVYALDARTGTPVWRIQTGGPVVASPRAADGVVYIGSGDRVFRAVELVTGRRLWSFDGVGGFVEAKPLVADGRVVFGAWDGLLYGLDARSGGSQSSLYCTD